MELPVVPAEPQARYLNPLYRPPALRERHGTAACARWHAGDSFDVGRRLGVTSHSFVSSGSSVLGLSNLASLGTPYSNKPSCT